MAKANKGNKRSKSGPKGKPGGDIAWGGKASKESKNINIILGVIALVAAVAGGLYLWQGVQTGNDFEALAAKGQDALARVETTANGGGGHLSPGQGHSYGEAFPTSGIHGRTPTNPGFYDKGQAPTQLVHAIEHGHIVIYYENPGEEALGLLKDWASLYGGNWDGVVATPTSGLGPNVVLTAWRKILRLDKFDPAAAAAFIDEFRGRGPENPVR